MKILHITQLSEQLIKTSPIINDIISDMILHGLKEVYGNDVIDYPGAWYMYKDEVIKRPVNNKLWGNGFTYYDSFENYKSTDRSDIQNKIKKNYFDYIIYGSFTRSCKFFEDSVNSKSKIILIDGEDNTNLNLNRNKKIIFFKRELLKKNENVFPLNISIPKKKIIKNLNLSPKNLLAPLIPYRYKTYIYNKENDYFNMWQNSLFGISYAYGRWWESVRYYEMLMNGCIPLILNLENCPKDTLTKLPKEELIEMFKKYSWILNKYFPTALYKKKFLTINKFFLYFRDFFKKKYNSKEFIETFPEINDFRNFLLEHTKKYLTTEYTAKYIINTANRFYL
tara:strand:+ start:2365 stop:3378 length:1014 start_codon:yes stop_codon:yes gene_type:complete